MPRWRQTHKHKTLSSGGAAWQKWAPCPCWKSTWHWITPFWVSGACEEVTSCLGTLVVQGSPAGVAAVAALCSTLHHGLLHSSSPFSWGLVFLKPWNDFPESYRAHLPWLAVLMPNHWMHRYKSLWAEPLLIPGALAVHFGITTTGLQQCSSRGIQRPPAAAFPAPAAGLVVHKALSSTQPGKPNAAFRHMRKSSFDISITHVSIIFFRGYCL